MRERCILSEPFECIALDLVSPLPKAKGGVTHVLTAMCLATRWPEAIALKSITAKAVAEGMLEEFGKIGLPSQILTENGEQFKSTFMADVTKYLGIDAVKTTPYHPQANGGSRENAWHSQANSQESCSTRIRLVQTVTPCFGCY